MKNANVYIGNKDCWKCFFEKLQAFAQQSESYKDSLPEYKERDAIKITEVRHIKINNDVNADLPQSLLDFFESNSVGDYLSLDLTVDDTDEVLITTNSVDKRMLDIIFDEDDEEENEDFEKPGKNQFFYKYDCDYDNGRSLLNFADINNTYLMAFKNDVHSIRLNYEDHEIILLPKYSSDVVEQEIWLLDSRGDFYRFRSFAELIIWKSISSVMYFTGSNYDITIDDLKRFGADNILDLDLLQM